MKYFMHKHTFVQIWSICYWGWAKNITLISPHTSYFGTFWGGANYFMFLAIFGWITLVEKFHCCIIFCPHEIALFYKLVICPWDGGQNSKFNKEGGSLHHQTFMLPSILFYCDHKYKYKYKHEQKQLQKRFARLSL